MKTNVYLKALAICFVVLTAFSLAPRVRAQAGPAGNIGKGRKAYSVPISDKEIVFKVTLPEVSGTAGPYSATIRVKEGGMAKVMAFHNGFAYALVPVGRGIDNSSADFTIYELTQDNGGNESIKEIEHVTSGINEVAESVKAQTKLQIKSVSITDSTKDSALVIPIIQSKGEKLFKLPSLRLLKRKTAA